MHNESSKEIGMLYTTGSFLHNKRIVYQELATIHLRIYD